MSLAGHSIALVEGSFANVIAAAGANSDHLVLGFSTRSSIQIVPIAERPPPTRCKGCARNTVKLKDDTQKRLLV
jgi:hypothetical protein